MFHCSVKSHIGGIFGNKTKIGPGLVGVEGIIGTGIAYGKPAHLGCIFSDGSQQEGNGLRETTQ